jgi:hypothetical protein
MRYFILTLLLLAVPALCTAETYKWIDEKGQTGYSDDLSKVPKQYRNSAVAIEKQEQAVEIIEKSEPEKNVRKGADVKADPDKESKGKDKDKPLFEGKTGEAWKQEFARQKYEVKNLEEQAAGIRERMADASKMTRNEYVTLQNTQRDYDVRIGKAKKKLEYLNEAADKAGVPEEFR